DEMSFSSPVEFTFVLAVGLAAMNRRDASFGVALAGVVDGFPVTADVLTDCRINEAVICFQENSCPRVVLGLSFTSRDEPLQRFAVFIRKVGNVFLRTHSGGYALREDKLARSALKLHSVGFGFEFAFLLAGDARPVHRLTILGGVLVGGIHFGDHFV